MPENNTEETIPVITLEIPSTKIEGSKGFGRRMTEAVEVIKEISTSTLETEMAKLLRLTNRLFNQAEQENASSGMQLDEVELMVEINSEGKINLVGTAGAKAGGKGAIKLKFKRASS